jgi:hypothetical protein
VSALAPDGTLDMGMPLDEGTEGCASLDGLKLLHAIH